MDDLLALVGFSFVSSVTPGPNNVLLWASGIQFGLRATVPHVVGTAMGLGSMALGGAAGIGVLVETVPGLALALRIAGSAYLVYLAYRIAGSQAMHQADVSRPLTLLQAAAFQYINPKAWFFALGAVTTFRPSDVGVVAGSLLVAATMMIVILPSAGVWAAGGHALGGFVSSPRAHRIVSIVLALLLVATIASIWV